MACDPVAHPGFMAGRHQYGAIECFPQDELLDTYAINASVRVSPPRRYPHMSYCGLYVIQASSACQFPLFKHQRKARRPADAPHAYARAPFGNAKTKRADK